MILFPIFVLITALQFARTVWLWLCAAAKRCLGLAIPLAFYKGALYGCQVPKGQGTVTSLM